MKKQVFIIYIFQVLFLSSYLFAADTSPIDIKKANQEIAEKILGTVSGCAERIWPGYDLKNLNVVLIDKNSEESLAISVKENKIFNINKSALPEVATQSLYAYFSINEQNWMSINTEEYVNKKTTQDMLILQTFKLAIHESFHETTQDSWIRAAKKRGTLVPIKWEPRYYRAMIYHNLVSAYKDKINSKLSLQRAKYWYEKWLTEYPEEAQATTDANEGTARYSDIMAAAVATLGCTAKEDDLNSFITLNLSKLMGKEAILNGYLFTLDGEGYHIGALASLILRRDQTHPDWQTLTAQGQTPLAILMKNIDQSFQEIDDVFKVIFLETQKETQLEVDKYLADTYLSLIQNNSYFISVPSAWFADSAGSIDYLGFYQDAALQLQFRVVYNSLKFISEDKNSTINSGENAVFLGYSASTPCEKNNGFRFIINHENISINTATQRITLDNKNFKGSFVGKLRGDKNGKTWICAGE